MLTCTCVCVCGGCVAFCYCLYTCQVPQECVSDQLWHILSFSLPPSLPLPLISHSYYLYLIPSIPVCLSSLSPSLPPHLSCFLTLLISTAISSSSSLAPSLPPPNSRARVGQQSGRPCQQKQAASLLHRPGLPQHHHAPGHQEKYLRESWVVSEYIALTQIKYLSVWLDPYYSLEMRTLLIRILFVVSATCTCKQRNASTWSWQLHAQRGEIHYMKLLSSPLAPSKGCLVEGLLQSCNYLETQLYTCRNVVKLIAPTLILQPTCQLLR